MVDPARILSSVRQRRDEFTDLLSRLVRLESPSTEPESQRPLLDLLAEELQATGFNTRLLPGRETGGHLFARPRSPRRERPLQLLLGHCDTVWPLGTLDEWPFEIEGDVGRGPGIYDMKGGLAMLLIALRVLCESTAGGMEVEPIVFISSDEEIGSPESDPHIRGLARSAERAFVLEPALGPEGKLKTRRKGVGRFRVTIRGRAAHAGLAPEEGASAVLALSHVVQQLFELNDPDRGITVNVGTITGGSRSNVVAAEASAEADVRVLHPVDVPAVEEAIHSLQSRVDGVELEIEGRVGRPPLERTPANRSLWRLASRRAEALGLEIEEGTAGGASDGNTTSIYTATLDGLGPVGEGAHARHEQIDVARSLDRAALLASLVAAPSLEAMETDEKRAEAAS